MIKPTIGRVVHVYRRIPEGVAGPFAGLITHVYDDRLVDVWVFERDHCHCVKSAVLRQPDDDLPGSDVHCEWMPYQVKKPTGSESGELEVGTQVIGESGADTQVD